MSASIEVTDRAVQEGDTVNIDYAGRYAESGEAFDGGTAQGYDLAIGSHTFIDGFEDGLIGAELGETRDLNLKFPENYGNADLAGVDVIFTVTVNAIKIKPDFDDAYAASLGVEGVTTIDELRTYIGDRLLEDKQATYDTSVQNKALEEATNGCMFENPPQALLDRVAANYADQMEKVAAYYSSTYGQQMTTDSVIQTIMAQEGYTGELEDYKAEQALKLAKQYIMLGAIAVKEGIEVTEEELNEKLTQDMEAANASAADDAKVDSLDDYKKTADVEDAKETLLTKKVVEFLAENANVVAPSAEEENAAEAESTENAD
jgi:trigger factor